MIASHAVRKTTPADLPTLDDATAWFQDHAVTFGLARGAEVVQRPIPFDPIPRVIGTREWARLERGLVQRVLALEEFVRDIYDQQRILRAGRIPAAAVYSSGGFLRYAGGPTARRRGQICVAGVDLVRVNGAWLVLEDNLRVPSGMAYTLAARRAMAELAPEAAQAFEPLPVADYPQRLKAALRYRAYDDGLVVLLTPGEHNAAFYEHLELARLMGAELVNGSQLLASHRGCWLMSGGSRTPVAAIYHRCSPEYLDPVGGRPDSLVGVPALMAAWKSGCLGLGNAPTCGVGDDKAVFAYVPKMIRYYLGEDPILEQPPTLDLTDPRQRDHALANFDDYVFKPVGGSGGKGIVFGPGAEGPDRAHTAATALTRPTSLVAQPVLDIERLPCVTPDGGTEWRRADLRPFVVMGEEPWVAPGGLTRVAPDPEGWLVNSSAGGGVKDTWIVEDTASQQLAV
ncbi:MAG: circularly permuted type 2 ATP-grasp protein [Candidatus Dormiibacterota bacterium]